MGQFCVEGVIPFTSGFINFRTNSMSAGLSTRAVVGVALRLSAESVSFNPAGGTDVCPDCCVLSVTGLCDELITRPEESYRLRRVVLCDLEI
jgi:hypothetical protein